MNILPKIFLTLFITSVFNLTVSAQNSSVKAVGNVTNVNISGQQIQLKTENAQAEITVYSPSIIRVRVDKDTFKPDFSYAVIAKPQTTKVNISQNNAQISIVTDSLKAIITKAPFSVSFYTLDGKAINEEEKGLNTSWVNESVTNYRKMQKEERFIGLGEKTGPLDRVGNGYTDWNSDNFGYAANLDPLYSTIPFYIGIHDNLNYGIFLDNTYQTDFNFGASNNRFSSFGARGGEMNYYFIYHKNLADVISSYTALTGRMKMPPLWSLGYQQNRYSYYPETEVYRIAQTLREKKIPADGITLDIHYMDKYKVFTWDKQRFPDPKGMTEKLKQMGFKLTVIVDPGVKEEKGYGVYDRGLKENIFIKYPDSTNYTGQVWPGWCNFPDFTNPKARAWWGTEINQYAQDGVSGIWNDMNEFSTWGQKVPDNVLFNYEGNAASHLKTHNVYALEMARASYEGARKTMNKRPFVLTRSGYAGLQRYTAIWTGDNRSEDDHMIAGVRLLNSLGLSGVPFTGMDIGGFTGNPTSALYARWIQIGAFCPYFRNHTQVNTKSSEPWTYGEEVTEISRNYISLRYKLLPYLYSTFYEATQNGHPVNRSLAIDYTFDPKIYDTQFQNQYLFGQAFLVAPFESGKDFGKVYFPKGKWYDLYSDAPQNGNQEKIIQLSLQKLPVYVKESSIIPMQSLVQTTAQKPTDTLIVHVYNGSISNHFVYYEDDGQSFANESGNFYKRNIQFLPAKRSIVFDAAEGSFASKFKSIKVVLHGFGSAASKFKNESFSFLTPVSTFDPQGSSSSAENVQVKTILVKNDNSKISIYY
ncbi:MAG: glycoside hydrolase family 31 protein [Janthinobacterium lividum]